MYRVYDYFQLIVLTSFGLVVAAKITYLRLAKRVNPIAIGVGTIGLGRVHELLSVLGLAFWMIEVISYALHLDVRVLPARLHYQLFDSLLAKLLGMALVTCALVVFILALFSFGDSWRVGIDSRTPGQIVTTGVFAVSRNPIYLSLDLYCLGTFLINGTLIFLVLAGLALINQHYQILREESFLEKTYGDAFRDYRARTGRYLTWKRRAV